MNGKSVGLALACLFLASGPALAADVILEASYLGSTIATGSFTYADGKTGVLGYGDLSSFSLTIGTQTYSLADVLPLTEYVQFAYDTSANELLANPNTCDHNGENCFSAVLSAINSDISFGFFFNPPPGGYADFANYVGAQPFDTLTLTPVVSEGLPDPATWLTMVLGFGLVGASLRISRPRHLQERRVG